MNRAVEEESLFVRSFFVKDIHLKMLLMKVAEFWM